MKNIIKLFTLSCLVLVMYSCTTTEGVQDADPTVGWVEFASAGTTISIITSELEIPIDVNVPVYEEGLNISYTLEPVQGDYSSILASPGNNVFVDPSDSSRDAAVVLNFANISDLTEIVIFDVVLTAVDVNGVNVGITPDSITSFRISTPCPIDIDGFAGSYMVEEMFTGPPNAPFGLSFFFGESYQVDLTVDTSDVTETTVIINNSPGFDTYFTNGITMSFDTCNFTFTMSEATPELALFSNMTIETAVYDEALHRMQADGTFGNFGMYQFILTKL